MGLLEAEQVKRELAELINQCALKQMQELDLAVDQRVG